LDTENYRNTIEIFTTRVHEIAESRLAEINNAAEVELVRLKNVINEAQKAIYNIHKELDEANAKYSI
jgi:hypothetical protein